MKLIFAICALAVFIPALLLAYASGWWVQTSFAALLLFSLTCLIVIVFEKFITAAINLLHR